MIGGSIWVRAHMGKHVKPLIYTAPGWINFFAPPPAGWDRVNGGGFSKFGTIPLPCSAHFRYCLEKMALSESKPAFYFVRFEQLSKPVLLH